MTVKTITKTNFQKEIVESDLPVITDFWASWCGPCQMMGPVFEEISEDYNKKLKFTKVDVQEEPELANQFSVMGIPCLVITKKGKEIDRITGFAPKELLKQRIDKIMEGL